MKRFGGPQPAKSSAVPLGWAWSAGSDLPTETGSPGGSTPSPDLLEVRRSGNALRVRGELDVATCPKLVAELNAAIEQGEADVIVDCADVTFFGAAGVSVFLCARQRLAPSGRSLILRRPSRAVLRVLEIVNLSELIPELSDEATT